MWSNDDLKQIALKIKYQQPNRKLTWLLLEKESGIGRNTWSRRMKEFINHLNSPAHIPALDESGIVTIPSVDELFLKYGSNTIELKNEITKLINIISDLYAEAKQLAILKEKLPKMQLEIDQLKNDLTNLTYQKVHYETLYNQIVAESYFPHLYGSSEKLKKANINAEIIPLPVQKTKVLKLDYPFSELNININSKQETQISKLNKMFDLDIE